MANDGIQVLKDAFDKGYNAFFTVEKNDKGFWYNTPNPYPKDSLPFKEFIRGFNRGYWEQEKKNKEAV